MERKEQRGGGGGGGGQQAQPAEQCEGEQGSPPAAVVQRTRVVLLAGEPWGSAEGCAGAPAVLSSFQHQVLPAAATAVSCRRPVQGRRGTTAAGLGVPPNIDEEGEPPTSTPPPAPSAPASAPPPPGGQLTFFLCRASSLRERAERLREVLRGVRDQRCGAPAALVGVLVQPRPEEEQGALARLEQLLRDVFQAEGGSGSAAAAMEMHTAVFAPGRPDGALELKRLDQRRPPAREAAECSVWMEKSFLMHVLGAALCLGTMAYGSYYFYNNPPL